MNVNINLENAVMIAGDYAYDRKDFEEYKARNYKGWACVRWGQDNELDYRYQVQQCKNEALWAVSAVTGIDSKVLLDMSRIEQKLIEKTQGQRCLHDHDYQRLLDILTAQEPRFGIWQNEYCDPAWERVQKARFQRNLMSCFE